MAFFKGFGELRGLFLGLRIVWDDFYFSIAQSGCLKRCCLSFEDRMVFRSPKSQVRIKRLTPSLSLFNAFDYLVLYAICSKSLRVFDFVPSRLFVGCMQKL